MGGEGELRGCVKEESSSNRCCGEQSREFRIDQKRFIFGGKKK